MNIPPPIVEEEWYAHFTLGVKAKMFNSNQIKSSISIGAKVEKLFSTCPKLLINAELDALVLAPRLKKGYHQIREG